MRDASGAGSVIRIVGRIQAAMAHDFKFERGESFGEWLHREIHEAVSFEDAAWAIDRARRVQDRLQAGRASSDCLMVEIPWMEEATAFTAPGRYIYFTRRLYELCPLVLLDILEQRALYLGDDDSVYGPDAESDDELDENATWTTKAQIWAWQRKHGYLPIRDRRQMLRKHLEARKVQGGTANGSQPIRSETNGTSSAAGSRR